MAIWHQDIRLCVKKEGQHQGICAAQALYLSPQQRSVRGYGRRQRKDARKEHTAPPAPNLIGRMERRLDEGNGRSPSPPAFPGAGKHASPSRHRREHCAALAFRRHFGVPGTTPPPLCLSRVPPLQQGLTHREAPDAGRRTCAAPRGVVQNARRRRRHARTPHRRRRACQDVARTQAVGRAWGRADFCRFDIKTMLLPIADWTMGIAWRDRTRCAHKRTRYPAARRHRPATRLPGIPPGFHTRWHHARERRPVPLLHTGVSYVRRGLVGIGVMNGKQLITVLR